VAGRGTVRFHTCRAILTLGDRGAISALTGNSTVRGARKVNASTMPPEDGSTPAAGHAPAAAVAGEAPVRVTRCQRRRGDRPRATSGYSRRIADPREVRRPLLDLAPSGVPRRPARVRRGELRTRRRD
jgi:hypothetical protein